MCTRLGADANMVLSLKAKKGSFSATYRFPCPSLLRDVLAKYLDICTPPTQSILKALLPFVEDDSEKDAIKLLSSKEGKDQYTSVIATPCLTVLEVLDKFPSLKPPLAAMLELLPRLQTRFYSISSSPKAVDDAIHLTVAVVRYATHTDQSEREGVASTWFDRMREGRDVEIFMRTSDFHMPKKASSPLVMVGPGTGLAPFRGFIQDRQADRKTGDTTAIGPMAMFFGCRSKAQDYIYQADLEAAEADGTITNLLTAFSRDQKEKVYVQHLIDQNQEMVYNLLEKEQGSFYVCGDAAAMARDVHRSLQKLFVSQGGLSEDAAEQKLSAMKKAGRYCLDVWA